MWGRVLLDVLDVLVLQADVLDVLVVVDQDVLVAAPGVQALVTALVKTVVLRTVTQDVLLLAADVTQHVKTGAD